MEHKNKTGITWMILFIKYFNIFLRLYAATGWLPQ